MKTFAILTLVSLGIAQSQALEPTIETIDEARSAKAIYINSEYLAYQLEAPPAGTKLPLVIYLHGAGGVGENIRKITGQSRGIVHGIERFKKGPCLIVAPQCRPESEKTAQRGIWTPADLDLLLEHLLATYEYLDPDRVYLTGNSMGGYGCWVWGGTSPEHFAAIAPVVGGIGRGGPKAVSDKIEKWATNLVKVPVYAFAGAKDKVVPAERSERMVAAIKKAGGTKAKIKVYPEQGHAAARAVYATSEFFDWMFSQKRGVSPPK